VSAERWRLHALGRIALVVLAIGASSSTASAQRLEAGGGVSASTARVARTGASTLTLTGPVLAAGGGMRFGRFSVEAAYLEGQLSPESAALGGDEVFAEARLLVRAQVGGGFSLGVGPRARAFIAPAGTVRWMRIEARGGYETEIIPGRARADVELWQVLSGEVNAQGGSNGGRGGSTGLTVRLPDPRFAVRLVYTADRVAFANGASEFVDAVELGLRIGRF
jgi:hypothetical protein